MPFLRHCRRYHPDIEERYGDFVTGRRQPFDLEDPSIIEKNLSMTRNRKLHHHGTDRDIEFARRPT